MEQTGQVQFHEKGAGRALIEIARQYEPKKAVREFVTNSVDSRVHDTREDIAVMVNPRERRIIISDNGYGMNYALMAELPKSVGYSQKAGRIDQRGEKGLGLLGFGSLGDLMHIISRPYHDQQTNYGYLRYEINNPKKQIDFSLNELTSTDIQKDFYGVFPHGTRIIVDRINPHIMEKVLTTTNLKNWLRQTYNPILRRDEAYIRVARIDRRTGDFREKAVLEPIEYERESSRLLFDEIVSMEVKNEDVPGGIEQGGLEIVLYIDPQGAYDKVAVYTKDVLVYESLAELIEFNRSSVWTSGKVTGYINDNLSKLILGRDGIDRQRNAFKVWYRAVKEVEDKIRPIVEETKKRGREVKEDNYIKKAFNALVEVWKDLKKMGEVDSYVRSKRGDERTVTGIPPEKGKEGPGPKPPVPPPPIPPVPPVPPPPGPGRFKPDEVGQDLKVVPAKGIPFGYPQPIEFHAHEMHLRSKLEDLLGKQPTLFLNSAHEDYKARVSVKEKDSDIFIRYMIDLFAKEAAFYDARKAEREETLTGEKSEIVGEALRKAERIKFLALNRLGIK